MVTRTSKTLAVCKLDITLTTTQVFSYFANQPWSVLLDSANSDHPDANFDIISFNPIATLVTSANNTVFTPLHEIRCNELANKESQFSPFELLKNYLDALFPEQKTSSLPFNGGILGSFSYDLGRHLEALPASSENDLTLPEMCVGFYDFALIFNYQEHTWYLVHYLGEKALEETRKLVIATITQPYLAHKKFSLTSQWQTQIEKQHYCQKFTQVQNYLMSGDCYQINLTQRFSAQYRGNEWQAYLMLRHSNKAPFSAFIKHKEHSIISISPERFIQLHGQQIETKPIKGTLPRQKNVLLDQSSAEKLRKSEKDRAENLMITDLMRNDLGKVATAGSVKVPKLFDIESFPAVHHLVSTVTASLRNEFNGADLLAATFPGGSITGAPKIRAMEIIEEIEPSRRSIYCGSIGYISQDNKMDTSITIRTLLTENSTIYCWAGGGIVADSEVNAEYQETFDKVSQILPVLEKTEFT